MARLGLICKDLSSICTKGKPFEELKYQYRPDIKDNITLNQNFREKFETLNHVKLKSILLCVM
jgi:hypothetical protein